MSEFISEFTGAQIDAGIKSANKVPTIEANISKLDTDKANKNELPSKLPNPQPLIINGEVYDGTTEVEVEVQGGSGGIEEAPKDSKQYGRQNGIWTEIVNSGSTENAVLYTAQTLTEAQKIQARANIGAGTGGEVMPLAGKKISFLGDSISNPAQSWSWITRAVTALGLTKLIQDGSVASTVCKGGYNSVIENNRHLKLHTEIDGVVTDPDIIVFFMGTNDWEGDTVLGSYNGHGTIPTRDTNNIFSNTYALILYEMSKRYPMARIWCGTLLPRKVVQDIAYPEKNALGATILDFNNAIRQVATAMNCNILDFANCGITDANIYTYLDDGTHPHWDYSGIGHVPLAEKMIGQLTANCSPTVLSPPMATQHLAGMLNVWRDGTKLYIKNGIETVEINLESVPEPPEPPVDPPIGEYTELDYIEFSGIPQWFDTGIAYSTNLNINVQGYLVDSTNSRGYLGFSESIKPLSLRYYKSDGERVFIGNNPYNDYIPNTSPLVLSNVNYAYSGTNESLTATASSGENTKSVTAAITTVPTGNLTIGMLRLDQYGLKPQGYRFKSLTSQDNTVNFVAAKNSEGKVGILDKVSNTFIEASYYSSYTGDRYDPISPENASLTKKCYDNNIIPKSTDAEQRQQLIDAGIDPDA